MVGKGDLLCELSNVLHTEGAIVSRSGDAGDAVAAFIAGEQGREVGRGTLCIPHTGETADHQDFGKVIAAVDEVGEALG